MRKVYYLSKVRGPKEVSPTHRLDEASGWEAGGVRLEHRSEGWMLIERGAERLLKDGDSFAAGQAWFELVPGTDEETAPKGRSSSAAARRRLDPSTPVLGFLQFLARDQPRLSLPAAWNIDPSRPSLSHAHKVVTEIEDAFRAAPQKVTPALGALLPEWKRKILAASDALARKNGRPAPAGFSSALAGEPSPHASPEAALDSTAPEVELSEPSGAPDAFPDGAFREVDPPLLQVEPAVEAAQGTVVFAASSPPNPDAVTGWISALAPDTLFQEERATGAVLLGAGRTAHAVDHAVRTRGAITGLQVSVSAGVLEVSSVRGQKGASGAPVQRARTLLREAAPGDILVDDAAFALVRDAFRADRDPGLLAHRVRALARRPTAFTALDFHGARVPTRGRDSELARLSATLRRVRSEGASLALTLLGPAGAGASRLLEETLASASREGALVLTARCERRKLERPLSLLDDLFSVGLRLQAGVGTREAGKAVADAVQRLTKRPVLPKDAAADAAWSLAAFLHAGDGALVPWTSDGDPDHDTVHRGAAAVRRLLDAIGLYIPVVILCDDLPRADSLSVRVLDLAMSTGDLPWLFVATAREDEPLPGGWGLGSHHERVLLDRLGVSDLEAMVIDRCGPGIAPDVARKLAVHAEGSPAMLHETLSWLVDTGTLVRRGDRFEQARPLGAALPPRAREMLLARVEQLDPKHRRVLRHIALVGRTAWLGCVNDLLGKDEVRASLGALRKLGFVRTTPSPEIVEVASEALRDALDELWTRPDQRRAAHARIADWLARERPEEDLAGLRALHLEGALRMSEAAKAHAQAGARAALLGQLDVARRAFERALHLLGDGSAADSLSWRLKLADVLCRKGDSAPAGIEIERASAELDLLGEGERRRFVADVAVGRAMVAKLQKREREALEILIPIEPKTAPISILLTQLFQRAGELKRARAAGLQGLHGARAAGSRGAGDGSAVCRLLMSLGGVDFVEGLRAGDPVRAKALFARAERNARWAAAWARGRRDDAWERIALGQIEQMRLERGEPVHSRIFERLLTLHEASGDDALTVLYATNVAEARIATGDLDGARPFAEKAVRVAERIHSEYLETCREILRRCGGGPQGAGGSRGTA